ncbi:MAG: outer membrane protein assembly factor BamD [Candidatus Omnitrophica bacterium]|nr:outer membrane protein assembly factor BamD [Candidatus Omnitrophota bacterium]
MKKFTAIIIVINLLSLLTLASTARAYWVWTPETKKFINPKYAVKDTPKEQYDWAMDFYNNKDYKRSAVEFEKLVKNYEYSEYAASSQYYVGLSYDNMGKYYIAFQNYQKAVDNFPHVSNIDEIIAREFNIGNVYASKSNPKVLGAEIMTSFDRAIEIYKKVVDNAPFGKFADEAQFKMAATLKEAGRYDEATIAFQKILDDYPESRLYDRARYEMANSAYRASLSPAYDAAPTDKALKAFEEFASTNVDEKLTKEARTTIKRLKNKAAEKSFMTAEFYEQRKHYVSAIIYYQDVINKYPDSTSAEIAEVRIADLKAGNYSHKKAAEFSAPKKAWTPWFSKKKKAHDDAVARKVVKVTEPAPSMAAPSAPVSSVAAPSAPVAAIATEPAASPATVQPEQKQVQDQLSEKAVLESTPAEVVKRPTGKRWWDYGLKRKDAVKTKKLPENKTKKRWTPLNFDNKTKGMKKDG